ncbi:REST corepressor 1 [Clonorchis sinensis]|uniref:REST corepressor 1 n=2 Tax=Clonorchis sinensis TaxID=79923 RepID=A0A8T1M4R6_CLOSI|nr:REST corepressor 1 [Clonorchis sinensis]GAA51739.1 REST corepressor [Clonorchis sinensis]
MSRQSTPRTARSLKTQRNQKECCSRVGPAFQAEVPELLPAERRGESIRATAREINLWLPRKQPSNEELQEYFKTASYYKYSEELAMILLHWHGYNVSNAMDDLPNYVPISSKWTKSEVRKFLKCIDSKPRKDFVQAKKTLPGRPMGEISQLYYSIAAPFKAPSRTKHHGDLIERCYARAARNNIITNRWQTAVSATSVSGSTQLCRRPGESEDALEREFEMHLVDMFGLADARRALGRRMLSTSFPVLPQLDGFQRSPSDSSISPDTPYPVALRATVPSGCYPMNGTVTRPLAVPPIITSTTYQSSSSGASSQLGSEPNGHAPRSSKHTLPSGVHYDHAEFLSFIATPDSQHAEERELELSSAERLDSELFQQVQAVEHRARSLLSKIRGLKPDCGFPEISYRWTKTELALVLTAMSRYGTNFAQIARTIGSKTESFIRDFYNQFRHSFHLDDLIRMAPNSNIEHTSATTTLKGTEEVVNTSDEEPTKFVNEQKPTHVKSEPDNSVLAPLTPVSNPTEDNKLSDSLTTPTLPETSATASEQDVEETQPSDDEIPLKIRCTPRRGRGRPARFSSPSTRDLPVAKTISTRGRGRRGRGRGRGRRQ